MISTLDIIGAIFSFLSTCYYININKLAWPFGLVAICIGIILYFEKGLYGDVGLHVIYLILTLYGWHAWLHGGKNHGELPISNLTIKRSAVLIAIAVVGIILLATILQNYTDSQVPYWDSTTTVLSLIAQWMICRKIIQCWHLWFIVDSLFAGMYFYKGIPAHGILNAFYVSMAIIGYLNWKNKYNKSSKPL